MESLFELPIMFYSTARTAQFILEFQTLEALGHLLPNQRRPSRPANAPSEARVRDDLLALLREDSRHIAAGTYPLSVLKPESPIEHLLRIPRLLSDGAAIASRRKRGRTTEFSRSAREFLPELPRYYRRNFHFQSNGYLSERSASLYEHQVELLFRGGADAMRRLILPELRERFGKTSGQGLRFLEIAAGTGRATRFVHLAYPKARITATDLSAVYLSAARRNLDGSHRIDFMQADGAELPFNNGHFDAVYSVFLFHELPMAARKQVLVEARRVLKPGGYFGLVDSIQKGDKPDFDPLLAQFPVDFHEPFYRDYSLHPMERLVSDAGFKKVRSRRGFFSKVVSAAR